jgi:tetratricopeptide (TPR) repeat protein
MDAYKEAARIDAALPEALVPQAMVELCYFRMSASPEEKFRKAMKAKPSLPLAHNGLGLLQAATGRAEACVASLRQAIAFGPLSAPLNAFLCYSLCFTRRFEDAIIAGRKAVLGAPESCLAHVCLGNALVYQGQYDDALIHLDEARSLSHDSKHALGFWAYACAMAGLREKAEQALSKLTSLPRHEYVPSYFVGLIHLGLGHTDLEGHDEGWRNLALCFRNGDGVLVLTNSSNGEGIFKPLVEALLGETGFPFDWEGYTPYDKLPPLPKLKEHKPVTLTAEQLSRLAGRYALSADIVLTITVENGRIYIREGDEDKQEYLAESPNDFYSATSTDECSFKPETGPAKVLVLHLDNGQNPELKRVP